MSRTRSSLSGVQHRRGSWLISFLAITAILVAAPLALAGDKGDGTGKTTASTSVKAKGSTTRAAKPPRPPKPGGGTISITGNVVGTVINSLTRQGLAGAKVTYMSQADVVTTYTDADGFFLMNVPVNVYYGVEITAPHYNDYLTATSVINGVNNILPLAVVEPVAPVVVETSATGTATPGETISVTGSCLPLDGSAIVDTEWTQSEGVEAVIGDPSATTTDVTVPDIWVYKDELIAILKAPPITEDQLPPGVELPDITDFDKGLQDRFQVVGINNFALERAEELPLEFTCYTSNGEHFSAVESQAVKLPWKVNPGLTVVPLNAAALLYAKEAAGYSWKLDEAPTGSLAQLQDASSQAPWLVPDVSGTYKVTEENSGTTFKVYSGLWHGALDPMLTLASVTNPKGDGNPEGVTTCVSCHYDKFESWRSTGHAEIFSQNLNSGPGGHYGPGCFQCHTVGFDPDTNSLGTGFDDRFGYQSFLDSGLLNSSTTAWTTFLVEYETLANAANVQCESCHGPQDYTHAHRGDPPNLLDPDADENQPRVSISADVCGSCHGEPLRHGRFQQWQLSAHADYGLAVREGDSGNCSRCHTGNGFIQWTEDFNNDPGEEVTVTWEPDQTHPQTCTACHDPHATGNTSGDNPNATVRVMDNTAVLVAGFQATGVGKGAVCMECHNSRRGLRNDEVWAEGLVDNNTRTAHPPTQTDILMGQNAYFVKVGIRGKHALVENTCVNCHMEKTEPPDDLSYQHGGTNHTFAADPNICSNCHGAGITAAGVQASTNGLLGQLKTAMGNGYQKLMSNALPVNLSSSCGSAVVTSADQIQSVLWNSTTSLAITYDVGTGITSCTANPSNINVYSGTPGQTSLYNLSLTPTTGNDGALLKAGWNYVLVNNDPGKGVHNPDFCTKALQGAIDAVTAL